MFIRGFFSRVPVQLSRNVIPTSIVSHQYRAIQHVARFSTMTLRNEKVRDDILSSQDLKINIVTNNDSFALTATHAAPTKSGITLIKHPFDLARSSAVPEPVAPDDQLFAIFRLLGKQFKVTKDDTIVTDHMSEVDLDQKLEIDDILLVGSKYGTILGHPTVAEAKVVLAVEEITRDKKVMTLKFRRRKNSRRREGFRRDIVILRVVDIIPPPAQDDHLLAK